MNGVDRLLRARAERYATAQAEERRILYTVVTFRRGEGRYALPLTGLCEIRPLSQWCVIPGASPVVLGVVYYRGELLSLHDLAAFASGVVPERSPSWVLVVEHEGARLGLAADDVMDVLEVEHGSVHPVPVTLGDASDLFAGMTAEGIMVVDEARMFESQRFVAAF